MTEQELENMRQILSQYWPLLLALSILLTLTFVITVIALNKTN